MGKKHSWFPTALLSLAAVVITLVAGCGGGEPQDVEVAVTIRDDQMSPDTIQVKQDDAVTLTIDSDISGAFHLHGYDIEREVRPGDVTNFEFTADATGRYRIAFHKAGDEGSSSHGHGAMQAEGGHGSMSHDAIESEIPVRLSVNTSADPTGGVNVFIATENWRWAPEEVNQEHSPGAGHAHIYVDGEKVNRVYGPAYHLSDLSPGWRELRVTLTTNSHNELLVDGETVEEVVMIAVEEPLAEAVQDIEPMEADAPKSLEIMVHPDAVDGYNLQAIPSGFRFTPENLGLEHVAGEGYGRIRVDGEDFARLYSDWFKLPALEPGAHRITVALYTNNHEPYLWEGSPVEATVTVEASMEMSQAGHHGDGESSGGMDMNAAVATEIDLGFLEVHPR